jgi:hypothetical protein
MDEYSRSGETRKDYCRRKNLSIHTFNNWWQKRREKDLVFAEVALPQHGKSRNATAIITFPNGITVKIKAEENLSVTAQLIREVIGC